MRKYTLRFFREAGRGAQVWVRSIGMEVLEALRCCSPAMPQWWKRWDQESTKMEIQKGRHFAECRVNFAVTENVGDQTSVKALKNLKKMVLCYPPSEVTKK